MVDRHHALESAADRRELIGASELLRGELAAARDLQLMAGNGSAQALARLFAHLRDLRDRERVLLRRREDGSGQRMLGVALQTRHQGQHLPLRKAKGDDLLRQLWLTVSEGPGFVEHRGPTLGDLLEHYGTLDDNRPAGAKGNRTDDGDWNGEKQRARGGDDQHRKVTNRFSTDHTG